MIGSWKAILLFSVGATALVAGFVRLQADLSTWRLGEIGELLTQRQTQALSDSFALLVGKMELLRRKAERQADAESDDVLEVRLRLMTPDAFPQPLGSGDAGFAGWERSIVTGVVTTLRVLQGKAPATSTPRPESPELRNAYLWERGRRYTEAVPLYRKALSQAGLEANQKAAVLLHLGFCQVLGGARTDGRLSFNTVSATYPGTDAAAAAKTLIGSLDYFEAQLAALPQSSDWAALGRLSFYLADYTAAERYLSRAPSASAETAYLLGRVAEETGRNQEAETQYKKAAQIAVDSPTPQAVPAAALRRLYLLSTVYEDKPAVAAAVKTELVKRGAASWVADLPTNEPVTLVPVAVVTRVPAERQTQISPPPEVAEEPMTPDLLEPEAVAVAVDRATPGARTATRSTVVPEAVPEPLLLKTPPSVVPLTPTPTLPLTLPSFSLSPRKPGLSSSEVLKWGLLATGAAAALTLGGSVTYGAFRYSDYQASSNSLELTRLHNQLDLVQTINVVAGILAAAGLGAGGTLWVLLPPEGSSSPSP